MKNKKGQVASLSPTVMTLIIVGVLLGAGLMILSAMQEVTWVSTSETVINETLSKVNETGASLDHITERNVDCVVSVCYNKTNPWDLIPTSNYTADGCTVAYTGKTTTGYAFNNTEWNCTYSYTYDADSVASNGTRDVIDATASLASIWLPVIVVVLAAGIVLAYLLGAFAGGKRK